MLERARHFLKAKRPTLQEARLGLRVAYAAAFFLQLVVALLAGGLLRLVASPLEGETLGLARPLQALALAALPLGLVGATLGAWRGGKGAALSAVLFLGGLLAVPVWFALLLFMSGEALYPWRLLLLLLLYFPLGGLVAGFYAPWALRSPPKRGKR